MSRATVIAAFFDTEAQAYRHPGEQFEASAGRVAEINAAARAQGLGPFVEAARPERPKAAEGE